MKILVLDSTTKSLKASLSSSITTANPEFVVSYADTDSSVFTEASAAGAFSGTSDITLVSAPSSGVRRVIKSISIYNKDTVAVVITLKLDISGTQRIIEKITLSAGQSWYNDVDNTIQLTTTVPVDKGGTGATTQQAAINALAGSTTSAQFLRGNGTNVVMSAIQASDVPTLNQNTTGTASNVTGTVAVANGGTGATTQQAAINALAGSTTSAQFLRGNGTNVVMSAIQASDVPTLNQNTTGSAASLSATLAVASGGTGQTTAQAAINSLAGATTSGQYLRGNGTNVVMSGIQAADVPTLNQNTTGSAASLSATLAVASGGTGQTTYTDGQLLIGNSTGNTLTKATLTAGSGISITNGSGAITIAALASSTLTISNKTAAYTVVAGDNGTIINCTSGTFTVSLTAAATLGSGFNCWVWNTSATSTDVITIDPNGAETIDGVATLILRRGEGTQIVCNGTNWETGDKKTMRGYAENVTATATRPTASAVNAIAIGTGATASASSSLALGPSALANAGSAMSLGVNASATGATSLAVGYATTSGSSYSTAIGANSTGGGATTATGNGAMALGGSYASGTDSFAAAITNNTSTYGALSNNSVAIGYRAKSNNTGSVTIGYNSTASGPSSTAIGSTANATGTSSICISTYSSIVSGNYAMGFGYTTVSAQGAMAFGTYWQAIASGQGSIAMGGNTGTITSSGVASVAIGDENTATADGAYAFGVRSNSAIIGKYAFANGRFSTTGDAQTGMFVLRAATTDAIATVLTTNGAAASTTNQVILPNNSAYHFRIQVIGMQQAVGGNNAAGYTFTGVIKRGANAAATSLLASSKTIDYESDTNWDCNISADTTNGGLAVTCTGVAATNIRWVATCWTSEVTYA